MECHLEESHKKAKIEVSEISASSKNVTAEIHPGPNQCEFVDQ